MKLTSELHQIARNPDGSVNKEGLRQVQSLAWGALGEAGRKNFFEFKGRQSCIKAAQAKPLPGAAGDAFIRGATKVDGETVREVMPIHSACLQAVESPLLKLVMSAAESPEHKASVDFNEEQQWEVCYIFTANPKALRQQLKNEGVLAIKAASAKLCDEWSAAKINAIMLAVIAQFHRHIQTTIQFESQVEAQTDAGFFRALREEVSKRPGQAGSLPTSADS